MLLVCSGKDIIGRNKHNRGQPDCTRIGDKAFYPLNASGTQLSVGRNYKHVSLCGQAVAVFPYIISQSQYCPCREIILTDARIHEIPTAVRKGVKRKRLRDTIFLINKLRLREVLVLLVRGGLKHRARMKGCVVLERQGNQRIDEQRDQRACRQSERNILDLHRPVQLTHRDKCPAAQGTQNDIFDKCLQMSQMYGLAKASTVHHRVENQQDECQQRKKSRQRDHRYSHDLSPHPAHQCGTEHGFCQGKGHSEELCGKIHEPDVQETEVGLHDELRANRVHKLQYPGNQKYRPQHERTETTENVITFFHGS